MTLLQGEIQGAREHIARSWLPWVRDQILTAVPSSISVHLLNQIGDLLEDPESLFAPALSSRFRRLARELYLSGITLKQTDSLVNALLESIQKAVPDAADGGSLAVAASLLSAQLQGTLARHFFSAADARLHLAEDEMRPVLSSSRIAFVLVDNSGRVRVWNEGFHRLTGFSAEDVVGRFHIFDLFPRPGDAQRILDGLTDGGVVEGFDTWVLRKGGGEAPVTLSASLLSDQHGRPAGSVGVCVDAGEKLRLEEERRNRSDLVRQVVERVPFPLGVMGPTGHILLANAAMGSLLGYPDTETLSEGLSPLEDEQWKGTGLAAAVLQALSGVEAEVPPTSLSVSDAGEERMVVVSGRVFPLGGPGGEGHAAVIALEDYTRLEFLKRQVLQSQKLSAVGQMLTGITHELNNKLCVILGYAELLEVMIRDEKATRHLDYVVQAADGARGIIQSLSTFARPREPRKDPVDLNRIVRDTLVLVKVQGSGRWVHLATDLDPSLPLTRGDAEQLGQVLLNLCINACQAMEGKAEGTLRVITRTGLERLEVVVEDDGPGIPQSLLDRVFDPFFTTKEPGKGTGLGLSVSYAIARAHGGELIAGNRNEGGARFVLGLPLRVLDGTLSIDPTPSISGSHRRSARVLVVDDEPMFCRLVADALEGLGLGRVVIVGDGEGAMAELRESAFDLVICDVRMPGVDGPTLFQWMREVRPEMGSRWVFVTGDTGDEATTAFLAETGCRCLAKPFSLAQLARVMDDTLGHGVGETLI